LAGLDTQDTHRAVRSKKAELAYKLRELDKIQGSPEPLEEDDYMAAHELVREEFEKMARLDTLFNQIDYKKRSRKMPLTMASVNRIIASCQKHSKNPEYQDS
jgi:hypothetical protein